PGNLRREPGDVLGLFGEETFGHEQGKGRVFVAGRLESRVEAIAHVLPEGKPIWPHDLKAVDLPVVRELGLQDDFGVPARQVLALWRDLADKGLVHSWCPVPPRRVATIPRARNMHGGGSRGSPSKRLPDGASPADPRYSGRLDADW